jgi:DNA-binding transcriptional ArsR family regulator
MPMISEGAEPAPVQVRPSAPLELMWLVHDCEAGRPLEGPLSSLEPLRSELGPRLKSFWGDGVRGFTEAVVLAQRSGTIFDLDLERFFARLDEASMAPGLPSLESETAAERSAFHARLECLRTDSRLRADYRALLMSAWGLVRTEWETVGRPAVERAAADWGARIASGSSYFSLLERPRIWPGRPELEELADAAVEDGRLVLSPGWFFGLVHVVEIDGTLYVGRRVRTLDAESERRLAAKKVAGSLKALADPTRLGIVLWLAGHPASVTEIARHFNLSQPTVSAHVQVLREAELLEEKASGRASTLTVTERRLKEVLEGSQEMLLRHFPKD